MALDPLGDLPPLYDVKGGSPRTPSVGIPVREYQDYVVTNGNGVWKAIASGLAGMVVGLLVAWFTAIQSKGITQKELQEYEDKYSPYVQQRDTIALHNATQDAQIGQLQSAQQSNAERMNKYDTKFHDDDRDILELQNKVKLFADFIEGQRNPKK